MKCNIVYLKQPFNFVECPGIILNECTRRLNISENKWEISVPKNGGLR